MGRREPRFEFRILGTLEVVAEGLPLAVGGRKQRQLLSVLLLHANEVVSSERLIEALWPEARPAAAIAALRNHVSGLRKTLGPERLLTRTPGYLVVVRTGELDLDGFERLAREGRFSEALSLFRGPPLGDVADQPFARGESIRIEELRLTALERRLDADLAAGCHAALVGELEALVVAHPLRERLRELLMLALYRSGRQAEALGAYQVAREELVEELGIEPGEELRRLQRAILAQDASLTLAPKPATPSQCVWGRRKPRAAAVRAARDRRTG